MGRSAVIRGLALCAIVLAFATALAGDIDRFFQAFIEAIEHGQIEVLERAVADPRFAEGAAEHPAQLRKTCEAVERNARKLVEANAAKAKDVAGRLVDIAKSCLESHAADLDATFAVASARVARGRMERASAGKPDVADWSESAALLAKAWEAQPGDGSTVVKAAELLFEGARLPGAPADELLKSADGLLEKALAKHPDSGPVVACWALRAVDRAGAPGVKKPETIEIVNGAADRLRALVAPKEPDLDAATAWNELVSFSADRKLGLPLEFKSHEVKVGQTLAVQVPVSRFFPVEEDASPSIHELARDLSPRRSITFGRYDWTSQYSFGGRDSPGGDNAKGIAAADLLSYRQGLAKERSIKDVTKGRLNPRIPGAYYWEAVGLRHKERNEDRARCWVFKSEKGHQVTYAVHVYDWDLSDIDPAARSILDSITEVDRK